jgi:Ca2+-binding EF-hand superfamily protein
MVLAPLSTVFEDADADHDGKLTFEEWEVKFRNLMNDEDLRILFDACDTDKNGTLDAEEFKRGLNGKYQIQWAQVLVAAYQLAETIG